VVVVEVEAGILNGAEAGNTEHQQRMNIGFGILGVLNHPRPARLQDVARRAQQREIRCRRGHVKAHRMPRAQIALDGGEVVRGFVLVGGRVAETAGDAELLVHPGDYANRSLRMQPELFDQLRRLHGHHHARRVINRPGTQVPRVEMAGDDHHLLGMLAALEIGDHVVRFLVFQLLRREHQMHAHRALLRKIGQRVGVFGGNRGRRYLRHIGKVAHGSRMRKAIVGPAHGAHQRAHRAQPGGGAGPGAAIDHGLSVGRAAMSGGGQLFVELRVKENKLARDLFAAQSIELVEIVHYHHFSGKSGGGCGHAAAQRREHDFLRGARSHPRKLNQRPGLFTPNPVGDGHLFQPGIEPQLTQLSRHILRGKSSLRRPRRTGTNIIGQVGELVPGIVAAQGRRLQLFQFSGQLRRIRLGSLLAALRGNGDGKKNDKGEAVEYFQKWLLGAVATLYIRMAKKLAANEREQTRI